MTLDYNWSNNKDSSSFKCPLNWDWKKVNSQKGIFLQLRRSYIIADRQITHKSLMPKEPINKLVHHDFKSYWSLGGQCKGMQRINKWNLKFCMTLTKSVSMILELSFLSYQWLWSIHCRSSSIGGCAPYTSFAGMLKSSTNTTHFLPTGGPKTPLRRLLIYTF